VVHTVAVRIGALVGVVGNIDSKHDADTRQGMDTALAYTYCRSTYVMRSKPMFMVSGVFRRALRKHACLIFKFSML
jgi:hypothetical protein